MKKVLLTFITCIILVSSIGVVLGECSGGSDLDINQIERVPGESTFKVIATANGQGDCLKVAWTESDLNDLLNKESPEELIDKDITGDIQLIEQKDTFHTSLDSSEKLFPYKIDDNGWTVSSCNTDNCKSWGYSSTEFAIRTFSWPGPCYCVYKDSLMATFGIFNGVGDRSGKAIISFSGLSPLNIDYGQSDGTKSNDKLTASWRGDLLAGHSISAPNYNVYEDSTGNFHLISSSFQDVKDATFDANGEYGITIKECLGESDGWKVLGISEAQNCINAYNIVVNQLLQDKTSIYLSSAESIVKSASFEGSNFIVEETPYSASYPQFTLTFDAEWAGVHWITGEPEVICPSDDAFISGESKSIVFYIKNIASEKGAFSLSLNCEGISSTLTENKLLLDSKDSKSITATLTASTEDPRETKCNFKAYATREPTKDDECSFNIEVEPKPIEEIRDINSNSSLTTGAVPGIIGKPSKTGIIIVIVIIILIAGALGFYFFNKKKTTIVKKVKKTPETKEKETEVPSGDYCAKCGATLGDKTRFCTKCGARQRK